MTDVAAPYFHTWTAQRQARSLAITGGQGAWFTTEDGGRWLDLGSLSYQAALGHGHPRMVEAICRQARAMCLAPPTAEFAAKRATASPARASPAARSSSPSAAPRRSRTR
jgi:adenosylmethionine-8-amino-7-oxononanoate aminotransferase